jgi:hypothetical protein
MTKRTSLWAGAAVLVALSVWAAWVDVPALVGKHKGDEATYVSMAFSLAEDGDLEFTKADLDRYVGLFGSGPEGLFAKRGPTPERLEYGKSYLYAVVAAPFAAVFGLGGLWLMNLLLLCISVACAVAFARARCGAVTGTVVGLSFYLATIIPVYVVWMTPEMLNITLVCVAYFLWLYKEVSPADGKARWRGSWTDWVAALLIGLATFSKPSHAPLIAPLVCYALWRKQWSLAAVVTAMFLVGSAGNYGINSLISGEWNYQGGERKTFYTNFPFESPTATFDSVGGDMSTNVKEELTVEAEEDTLAPAAAWRLIKHNAGYFLFGQNAGLVPYFFPGALIGLMFLWHWRRAASWQWLVWLAGAGAAVILLVITPYSWSGGGGPVGNRYYISIYPVLLFLLPAGFGLGRALVGAIAGLMCMGTVIAEPVSASLKPWTIAERWPLRLLPVELTLLDDSPVRLNPNRGRIPFWIHSFALMYYMDGNSYSPEPAGGVPGAPTDGFWIAGDRTARIALRSGKPLMRVELTFQSRLKNTVTWEMNGRSGRVELAPDQKTTIQFSPELGVKLAHSYAYLLTMTTTDGFVPKEVDSGTTDDRNLGVFLKPTFRTDSYGVR